MKQASFEILVLSLQASHGEVRHSIFNGDHLATPAAVSRCAVEMTQGHGEHASRRFHFVREVHTNRHATCEFNADRQPYRLASQTVCYISGRLRFAKARELYQVEKPTRVQRLTPSGGNASLASTCWAIHLRR